ncbi:MAG: thymidylate synthase [Candidatus Omnitrophica bacterium]|nr:thymidylate synthase [Candidatus Omnitrophota bacterium]
MRQPVLLIRGKSIAETWEKSLVALWKKGISVKTEYDRAADPASRDATVILVVRQPLAEPRIHLGFPGGLEDLEKYRQEVVLGIHDHWIDPTEGKWTYTYHSRLFNYSLPENPDKKVNQIDLLVEKLAAVPYTRRAQAITWIPFTDPLTDDPPCLQRIWCRLLKSEEGEYSLVMNTHWRSRDAYRAAFMNLFGLTELQREIARRVSEKIGNPVHLGQYTEMIDSYHIYGESFTDFTARFLPLLGKRRFYDRERLKSRTLRSDDPVVTESVAYARCLLEKEKESGQRGRLF